MNNIQDVIDLTDSFTLVDHSVMANVVIEIDDSFNNNSLAKTTTSGRLPKPKKSSTPRKKKKHDTSSLRKIKKTDNSKSSLFGDCPICWDELGNNPLASTKCGHVYCLKCLEESLRQERRCPTCRRVLKGASAYHPLYLAGH